LRLQPVLGRELHRQGGNVDGAAQDHPASSSLGQEQGRNLTSG